MFKTIKAYKKLIKSKSLFALLLVLFIITNITTSLFVFKIKEEIQDALLTMLSIIFPLIAGFLTFGRETLKKIKDNIETINNRDLTETGPTTTDSDKKKIRFLKDLSTNFINVVISTFFVSFMLIIFLLIAKFNDYGFSTAMDFTPIKDFLFKNWLVILTKLIFFYLAYTMLLNTLYLTIYIIRISKDDSVLEL